MPTREGEQVLMLVTLAAPKGGCTGLPPGHGSPTSCNLSKWCVPTCGQFPSTQAFFLQPFNKSFWSLTDYSYFA